jgi:putative membrane-bound dehydrogenase-like protein
MLMNRFLAASCVLLWLATPLFSQGFSPDEAVRRMKVPEGLQVKLVASEPMIRQPVTMSFDDRGRLWVVQYLQYPNPAGLKAVKVDQYLRTVYDRVPEPPPRGPKGADRITILSDPDENGRYRKSRDFVTGLNLASGMCLGNGGVYVVQPPYLLFYPDKNGDDVPDGDPEVLLTGFGMEDSHAFANSLTWGPDGWLYGAQGSTVTAKIRGIEFQQGIWRYHPITREFELFSEGGGNTWGLDFDRHGNVIAGTNWSLACLHQVQGGYYIKGFAKHGPLHNPHTYGYFDHIPCPNFKGGHVTCGGILYQGGALPERFTGRYIAGNLLANAVYWYDLSPRGSSFASKHAGELLVANDTWFRPVDLQTGPDGAVYVADWYDKRANHVDPVDNWDKTNGRIYKIESQDRSLRAAGGSGSVPLPLSKLTSDQLTDLLNHPNDWYVREARRILAERRDHKVIPRLRQLALEKKGQLALEALWALYVSGGFDDAFALKSLHHENEDVRTWTVRLLCDPKRVSTEIAAALTALARTDTSPTVRSQLACSAKRLRAHDCLAIVRELLRRDEDVADPHIPLLLWWAIESKAVSDRDQVLALFSDPANWRLPLVRNTILERIGRRYLAEGGEANLKACAHLMAAAPGQPERDLLLRGMEKALEGRRLSALPAALEKPMAALLDQQPENLTVLRVAFRLGSAAAYRRALEKAGDAKTPEGDRISLIDLLGQSGKAECVPILLHALAKAKSDNLRSALLTALQAFPEPEVAGQVLTLYPRLSGTVRSKAQTLLLSRPASRLAFLQAVDAGRISPKELTLDQVRQLVAGKDETIVHLVEKHWGKVAPPPPGAKIARINAILHALGQRPGDPVKGKEIFTKTCATCHTLHGEGNKVGPDLTTADRKNRQFMVTNIVDPSAIIRSEFVAYVVATRDGRQLTGLIVETNGEALTLVNEKNERTILAKSQIEEMSASPVSLMPEGLLDPFDEQQIRDLFAYLQSDPLPAQPRAGAQDKPLRVCLVSGSVEYDSDKSLAAFQEYLKKNYNIRCSRAFRKADDDLPGLENLDNCDVMLLFTRRLTIQGEQLERIKKYCTSGKPIVAVRTASHAFQNWLALDKEVLGGDYHNHYPDGPQTRVILTDEGKKHPILAGVQPFKSPGSLYKNPKLASDVEVLLTGDNGQHTEPIAWTRTYKGGRIFYTSLGHPKDFENDNFKRMLANALFWTTRKPMAK